jgi:polysaccharide biosynthesis protein PslG
LKTKNADLHSARFAALAFRAGRLTRRYSPYLIRLLFAVWLINHLAPATPRLIAQPPQTVQTRHPIVCVHTRLTDEVESWKIQRTLQLVREMGAAQIVEFFPWAYVEGTQGRYDWAHPDRIIELAAAQGITVIARLGTIPNWAMSREPGVRQSQYALTPDYYDEYAKFVGAFAARYRGRVASIIPWNEPNLSFEWGYRQVFPVEYVGFLKMAYEAAHAANPEIQIIGGALAPNLEPPGSTNAISDLPFLRGMLDAGGAKVMDALSVHSYDLTRSPPETAPAPDRINFRRTELLQQILAEYGVTMPIYITETGWNDHPRWVYAVQPGDRIVYTLNAFRYAEQHWSDVRAVCIWNFRTPAPTRSYPDYWQLVWPDFQTRPIYDAIRAFARGS